MLDQICLALRTILTIARSSRYTYGMLMRYALLRWPWSLCILSFTGPCFLLDAWGYDDWWRGPIGQQDTCIGQSVGRVVLTGLVQTASRAGFLPFVSGSSSICTPWSSSRSCRPLQNAEHPSNRLAKFLGGLLPHLERLWCRAFRVVGEHG